MKKKSKFVFRSEKLKFRILGRYEPKKSEDLCYGPRLPTGPRVLYRERAQVLGLVPSRTHTHTPEIGLNV